jgi:hypothetical protein
MAELQQLGWPLNDWAKVVGCSRALVYELLADRKIASKKLGAKRLIVTPPAEFLASLPDPADKAA